MLGRLREGRPKPRSSPFPPVSGVIVDVVTELVAGLVSSPLVCRLVTGVQRDQPQKVAVPVGDCPDPLTQPQRIHLAAVRRPEMLDRLPAEPGMAIEAGPIELAQPTK